MSATSWKQKKRAQPSSLKPKETSKTPPPNSRNKRVGESKVHSAQTLNLRQKEFEKEYEIEVTKVRRQMIMSVER